MQHYLTAQDAWFDDLIDYRDALAHRIALYIPPRVVSRNDEDAHKALEARKRTVSDIEEFNRLTTEQRRLERFHPIMGHALDPNKPPPPFHFQDGR